MNKVLLTVIIVLVVLTAAAIAVMYYMQKGPDPKQFEHLINPSISKLPNQHMLVVEAKGDPNISGATAIKLLFKTYYSLSGVNKSKKVSPRARWPIADDSPKNQWLGLFALPIPPAIKTLPKLENPEQQNIFIADWEYGTVAEILHKGSYDTEKATVQKLKSYIKQQGYTIVSEHEEDYLKGPGMFGPGNPDKYLTIIRYRVMKLSDLMKM